MPLLRSAIKKQRQDRRRHAVNSKRRLSCKMAITSFKKGAIAEKLKEAYRQIDRLAKTGLIHKNKAARLKSRLSKKLSAALLKDIKSTPRKKLSKKNTAK